MRYYCNPSAGPVTLEACGAGDENSSLICACMHQLSLVSTRFACIIHGVYIYIYVHAVPCMQPGWSNLPAAVLVHVCAIVVDNDYIGA